MSDIVMWDDKHKIVEVRLCRIISVDNEGKSTFEKDCTECKHCRIGGYTMCSDGCKRRFSKCMAKGEPYTILFDYGRCELFTDKESKGE